MIGPRSTQSMRRASRPKPPGFHGLAVQSCCRAGSKRLIACTVAVQQNTPLALAGCGNHVHLGNEKAPRTGLKRVGGNDRGALPRRTQSRDPPAAASASAQAVREGSTAQGSTTGAAAGAASRSGANSSTSTIGTTKAHTAWMRWAGVSRMKSGPRLGAARGLRRLEREPMHHACQTDNYMNINYLRCAVRHGPQDGARRRCAAAARAHVRRACAQRGGQGRSSCRKSETPSTASATSTSRRPRSMAVWRSMR